MPRSSLCTAIVLVIEDHPDQRELLEVLLQRDGYQVITAGSGIEALQKLETNPVQIVLTDIRMPSMDGFELCRAIRSHPHLRNLYLIFLTAKILERDRLQGLDVGADDYIIKPFSSAELLARVRIAARVVQYQQHLQTQEIKDSLTGVLSQRAFEAKMDDEFQRAKRYQRPLSLLLLDVDDFNAINDTYGYHCGDTVLKSIAAQLQARTRRSDFPARYGGGFALVLPETGLNGALMVAKKLCADINMRTFGSITRPFTLTVSAGVSSTGDKQCLNWQEILDDANRALRLAKSSGKNKVEVFVSENTAKPLLQNP